MKIQILSANLGNFDKPVDPVKQETEHDVSFYRFTDENFPPITGLTPRLQYRIPKTHGWQWFPEADYIIWLDGTMSFERKDCVDWYLEELGDSDIAFFKHPFRNNIRQEVEHIEEHLRLGKPYITCRYKNGLHREFLDRVLSEEYKDETLYASTAFIFKNTEKIQKMMEEWLYTSVRYFTCDQVQLPFVLWKHGLNVKTLSEPIYKSGYLSLISHHK